MEKESPYKKLKRIASQFAHEVYNRTTWGLRTFDKKDVDNGTGFDLKPLYYEILLGQRLGFEGKIYIDGSGDLKVSLVKNLPVRPWEI